MANETVPVRQKNERSLENSVAVRDSVRENPIQSIPRFWSCGIIGPYFFEDAQEATFCGLGCMVWILQTCGSNRLELLAILQRKH